MPVVIDRRLSGHLICGTLLVAWTVLGAAVMAIFWRELNGKPSPAAWAGLVLAGGFFAGVLFYLAGYYGRRLVLRVEFGEALRYRTLFAEGCVSWGEVGRFVLKELATPVPTHCTLKLVLTCGRRLEVWANREQAEAAFELARQAGLARGWPGLPLWRGTAWALLGLGTIALAFGAWLGWFLAGQLAAPGPAPDPEALAHLIGAAIVVPLLGLAGIGLGAYHLVRAPLVIRGGLFRIKEGEKAGTAGMVQSPFGSYD